PLRLSHIYLDAALPQILTLSLHDALPICVAHVFNSWTEMPPIGEQVELGWTFSATFTVSRALLKPGRRYSDAVKQFQPYDRVQEDRKSTRLNSSHQIISYAVFCLKKKNS